MKEVAINNKFYIPLLVAIPLVWIGVLMIGSSTVDIQMHDTYFVIGKIQIGVLFTILLGVKALLYYSTRSYPLSPYLCWFDIVLTLAMPAIIISYAIFSAVILSTDTVALLFLLVATWMLMQFFIGVNYFLVMFMKGGKKGNSLF